MIGLAEKLAVKRIELANAQYYGWAFLNRRHLLPTRQQIDAAMAVAKSAKARLAGKMEILLVARHPEGLVGRSFRQIARLVNHRMPAAIISVLGHVFSRRRRHQGGFTIWKA
jgi:hypothetical protein